MAVHALGDKAINVFSFTPIWVLHWLDVAGNQGEMTDIFLYCEPNNAYFPSA